jgi:hypothetical protein
MMLYILRFFEGKRCFALFAFGDSQEYFYAEKKNCTCTKILVYMMAKQATTNIIFLYIYNVQRERGWVVG